MNDSFQSFSAMLRQALGDRIDAEASTFPEMMADHGVMEFPYAPSGFPARIDGRQAVVRHLEELSGLIAFDGMSDPVVHPSTDPDVVVVEFEGSGRGVATGEPYEQRYVSVIRTRDGRIVHYRDYWNPLAVFRATRGAAFVEALVGGEAGHD